jgi:hypothetical protein
VQWRWASRLTYAFYRWRSCRFCGTPYFCVDQRRKRGGKTYAEALDAAKSGLKLAPLQHGADEGLPTLRISSLNRRTLQNKTVFALNAGTPNLLPKQI